MTHARRALVLLVLLILPALLFAQVQVEPAIFVENDDEAVKLSVGRVEVETRILGSVAETSMTIVFGNPLDRVLAGDLYVPLPSGATVSGYALDVEGVMVDGVVVDRDRGREVFEEITRQGVDPGLVEWTQGNVFKTRVFPIPARGSRTIRIRYISDLNRRGSELLYRLPLAFPDRVPQFRIRVEVVRATVEPEVREGGLANFSFETWSDSFVAETTGRNADLSRDLVVALPEARLVGAAVESDGEESYFLIRLERGDEPAAPVGEIDEIALYWDASRSRRDDDNAGLIALLEDYLSRLGSASVRLTVFRDSAEDMGRFTVAGGRSRELSATLRSLAYDGATQPGSLPVPAASTDMVLLVTDGIATFGDRSYPASRAPVFVLAPGGEGNEPPLAALARATGGAFFNLDRVEPRAVLDGLGRAAVRVLDVRTTSGSVSDLAIRDLGDAFAVAGRLQSRNADVVVELGVAGGSSVQRRVRLDPAPETTGRLLAGYWAQTRLNELLADQTGNAEEIRALGRDFGLVTPGTSLIVLESLDQYVDYRIPPPRSLPEMRREYFVRIAELDGEKEDEKEARLEAVLADWQRRVEWWETDHAGDFQAPEPEPENPSPLAESGIDDETSYEEPDDSFGRATGGASPSMLAQDAPAESDAASGEGAEGLTVAATTELIPWDPDTPYLRELESLPRRDRYGRYLELADEWASAPAFFLDVGDLFFDEGEQALALRIWSNLAEIELENPGLLRVLAHRLDQAGSVAAASGVFRQVLSMRPEEPQSYRDLALVLARIEEYTEAIELLWEVVVGDWDGRFPEITNTALMEMNNLIPRARRSGMRVPTVDERFVRELEVDLRVVLTWDADLTDMDLWVTSPTGERIYYGHPRGAAGEYLSRDYVSGYGPEEYFIRDADKGSYRVQANYFGSRAVTLAGSVTLQVEIFTNYGRPDEERKAVTFRLRGSGETVDIGSVSF